MTPNLAALYSGYNRASQCWPSWWTVFAMRLSVHRKLFSNIPGFCPTDANSTLSPASGGNEKYLPTLLNIFRKRKIHPISEPQPCNISSLMAKSPLYSPTCSPSPGRHTFSAMHAYQEQASFFIQICSSYFCCSFWLYELIKLTHEILKKKFLKKIQCFGNNKDESA